MDPPPPPPSRIHIAETKLNRFIYVSFTGKGLVGTHVIAVPYTPYPIRSSCCNVGTEFSAYGTAILQLYVHISTVYTGIKEKRYRFYWIIVDFQFSNFVVTAKCLNAFGKSYQIFANHLGSVVSKQLEALEVNLSLNC